MDNYYIVTNLKNRKLFNNNKIIELYKLRWEIEIFFKLLKNNFKFEQLKSKDDKLYIIISIIIYITKILTKTATQIKLIK